MSYKYKIFSYEYIQPLSLDLTGWFDIKPKLSNVFLFSKASFSNPASKRVSDSFIIWASLDSCKDIDIAIAKSKLESLPI